MRIATFNVDCFGAGRSSSVIDIDEARIAPIRAAFEGLRADILCLQEVNAGLDTAHGRRVRTLEALDLLIRGTRYEPFHWCVSTLRDGSGPLDVHNLVTLSRYPILEHRQLWHDLVPPLAYAPVTAAPTTDRLEVEWDRPVLYASLKLDGGQTLHVLNLHLRAPLAALIEGQKMSPFEWRSAEGWAEGFLVASIKRAGQALEARLAIDLILDADPDALVLACGDMNADLFETPVRILRADVDDTGNAGLEPRMLRPVDSIAPDASRYSVVHAGHRFMLDHILASRALWTACRGIEIHNEGLRDEIFDEPARGEAVASNHAPLVAEFGI